MNFSAHLSCSDTNRRFIECNEKNATGFDRNRHCGKKMDVSSARERPRDVDSTTGRYVEIYGAFRGILQDFRARAFRGRIQIHGCFERP